MYNVKTPQVVFYNFLTSFYQFNYLGNNLLIGLEA